MHYVQMLCKLFIGEPTVRTANNRRPMPNRARETMLLLAARRRTIIRMQPIVDRTLVRCKIENLNWVLRWAKFLLTTSRVGGSRWSPVYDFTARTFESPRTGDGERSDGTSVMFSFFFFGSFSFPDYFAPNHLCVDITRHKISIQTMRSPGDEKMKTKNV